MIGILSAVSWGIAAVAMVIFGYHADCTGEWCWHVMLACLASSIAFSVCGFFGVGGWTGFVALTIVTAGIMSALSSIWTLPAGMLTGQNLSFTG